MRTHPLWLTIAALFALAVVAFSQTTVVGLLFSAVGSNTFAGVGAGGANTTGSANTFYGGSAGLANTTGIQNTFAGHNAGAGNTTGIVNTFVGQAAGYANTTGAFNAFYGASAGFSNTTGAQNTFVGQASGYTGTPANANVSGANNTWIGSAAGPGSPTQYSFQTVIGSTATGTCSNCVVLGRSTDQVQIGAVAFASLGAVPAAGTAIYCTNCTLVATCAGAGTGHMAVSNGTNWTCN